MYKYFKHLAILLLMLFVYSCGNDDNSPQIFNCNIEIDLRTSECLAEDILNSCFFYGCEDRDQNLLVKFDPFFQDCEFIDCTTFICNETLYENIQSVIDRFGSFEILTNITNDEFVNQEAICFAAQT